MSSRETRDSFPRSSPLPNAIICIYAQEDAQFYRELQRYLYLWVRQQKVIWLEIIGGDVVEQVMEGHLRRADLILLLLSPDFLATDSSYHAMLAAMTEGMRRQVPVVPLLVRTSPWKESECGMLQALPEQERPIVSWKRRDDAYENIRQGLLHLLSVFQADARSLALDLPFSLRSRGFQIRDLPGEYVVRPTAMADLKQLLFRQDGSQTTAITTALRGTGGFGKTTLALALCHDPEVQAAFPDGIFWIELGEQPPRTLNLLNSLLTQFGANGPTVLTLEDAQKRWETTLANKTCLLVIDDVWQMAALKPLLCGGPGCKHLVTTRNDQVLPVEAARVVVDAMSEDEAIAVLCQGQSVDIQQTSAYSALAELVKQLGYWPLLLSIARGLLVTQLRYGRPLVQVLSLIKQVYHAQPKVAWQQGNVGGFYEAIDVSLKASLRQLQEVVAPHYHPIERYEELAIFPEDIDIPIASLHLFWKSRAGLEQWEVDDLCMQLHSLSLILTCDLSRGTIRLHDVLRSYLVKQVGSQLPILHTRFLDAVWHGLRLNRWADMPAKNRYLWQHLLWHLCQAKQWEDIQATLTDMSYLIHKVLYVGVAALEIDLLLAKSEEAVVTDTASSLFTSLHRTIVRISHLLRQVATQAEIGGLLLSHLGVQPPFAVQRTVFERKLPRPFLTAWHPLPQRASSALLRTLHGHSREVFCCAVSPDGRKIVSASGDRTLKVWDAATGAELLTLVGHRGPVTCCAVSPDGRTIVSASTDNTLKIWDALTGAKLLTLAGHINRVNGCAMSPDGHKVVSASADSTLKVWDAATGTELLTLAGHRGEVSCCAVSPDGHKIVSASADSTLKIWDAATGAELLTLASHRGPVAGCAVSPDGRKIVSASDDRTLKVWDAATGVELLTLAGHRGPVTDCAVSPDGYKIVSASGDLTLKVWDAATGAKLLTLAGHINTVIGCAMSPDGCKIVSASGDLTLRVWDAATGAEFLTLAGHRGEVSCCAVSPDGRKIISASADSTLKIWDAATGAELLTLSGHHGPVTGCAVSPDGRKIVSASADSTLKIWDAATGAELLTFVGSSYWGFSRCAVSPDGHRIVSTKSHYGCFVWDAATGAKLLTLSPSRLFPNMVIGCAVSPDGRKIVFTRDYELEVWDATTGAKLLTLSGHANTVIDCAVSPDGCKIVSASEDNTLKVWDAATGAELLTLSGHHGPVSGCAVSPNGRFIISASSDKTLRMWDTQTGQCLLTFPVDGPLSDCAFHPDGEHLVACGTQGMFFLRLVV